MPSSTRTVDDEWAIAKIGRLAAEAGLDVVGGTIRRTSSRFCLGVEHGDYNGTELFGVGTDRYIWMASKGNDSGRVRLFSGNYREDGIVAFEPGCAPPSRSPGVAGSWARYAFGVDTILRREGSPLCRGVDAILIGNIPGGGMSRSASLCLNLILSLAAASGHELEDPMRVARLAQAVENDYVGSPCGLLDQIMIVHARAGMGTHYDPHTQRVTHVPLGDGACDFRFVGLDTGTVRPGLETSTYRRRREECDQLTALLEPELGVTCLADIRSEDMLAKVLDRYGASHPALCLRLRYIHEAQRRFAVMIEAWKAGDVETVGRVFRADGLGLRDLYQISGPELETMCDIARTVPGVLGERMLGGGDKGAAGALVRTDSVEALETSVATAFPRSFPALADAWAVHVLRLVDGISVLDEGSWANA